MQKMIVYKISTSSVNISTFSSSFLCGAHPLWGRLAVVFSVEHIHCGDV